MTHRPSARRTALLSTTLVAAALATAAPGAVATASAQPASDPSVTLTLNGLDRNHGSMHLTNVPADLTNVSGFSGVHADAYNGQTTMQPLLDGTERAEVSGDTVYLNNLVRGATYAISVKFTDPNTGQARTSNTVTFTTQPSTDTQAPSSPTNLNFVPIDSPPSWRQLNWNQSTDNSDPSSDIQYVVRRNGQLDNGIGEFAKGDVFTVTAIDTSNNASTPASITYDGQ